MCHRIRDRELRQVVLAKVRALAIARELDDERQRGGLRSSLHGVPIGIKSVCQAARQRIESLRPGVISVPGLSLLLELSK